MEALPYAHNETDDPLILFADGYGTCFTKHAVVARLAAEIGVPVQKYLGFYRLTDDIVTGVGAVLRLHGLPFIPQMHCFIGYAGLIVDLTAGNATGRNRPVEDYDFIVRLPGEPTARDLQRLYGVHLARYAAVEPRLASLTIADASRILADCDAIANRAAGPLPVTVLKFACRETAMHMSRAGESWRPQRSWRRRWPPDCTNVVVRIAPIALEGNGVRLEPLAPAHADGLRQAASDGELWTLWYTSVPAPAEVEAYIESALAGQAATTMLPWAVRELATGAIVGSTRYHDIVAGHRSSGDRLHLVREVLAAQPRQHRLQAAAFGHAFDTLGCRVVGLRTDNFNFASQQAIAGLGAKRDGIIRHHQPRRDGTVRDTHMFSVLAAEWPDVKRHLTARIERHGSSRL